MPISAEQCVSLLHDALANRPTNFYSQEAVDWFADVTGIVQAHDPAQAIFLQAKLDTVVSNKHSSLAPELLLMHADACEAFIAAARAIYTRIQLETNSFTTKQLEKGAVFDYFREVQEIIQGATRDILFIDPYLDGEFISKYLPQVRASVTVRLLTVDRQADSLKPAVELYNRQHGTSIQLRVLDNKSLHDRHLVIDSTNVFQSGASFKDGAKNAPTSINQIVDVAIPMITEHERRWASATVVV
jgi:hypothetical protein